MPAIVEGSQPIGRAGINLILKLHESIKALIIKESEFNIFPWLGDGHDP
jgi:hypothetical protein